MTPADAYISVAAAEPAWVAPADAELRWLTEVRLRITRRVLWVRQRWLDHHYENEHLLAISHSEVDRALASHEEVAAAERAFRDSDPRASALTDELAALGALTPAASDGRFAHVVGTLGLNDHEAALLKLALAAAVDPAIPRVLGYLLDLAEPADPTPSLAASLYDLPPAAPPGAESPLVLWWLATPAEGGAEPAPWAGWRLDPPMLTELTRNPSDGHVLPGWSTATARPVSPPGEPVLQPDLVEEIAAFVTAVGATADPPPSIEIELIGAPGSGRTTLAAQAAARAGRGLVTADAARLAEYPQPSAAVRIVRGARLDGAALEWEHADVDAALLDVTPPLPLRFLSVQAPLDSGPPRGSVRRSFQCRSIGRRQRIELWSSRSDTTVPEPIADWALRPAEITAAASVAAAGERAVADVCRRALTASRPDLLTPLPLPYTWSDLVLAPGTLAHLRELEAQARDRAEVLEEWALRRLTPLARGTTALLSGPAGTGKTMAAQVLARSLGLELFRADLAGVVNKYIGETEKHLRELFDVCERAPALLLFDEADALFGKRSQVNDARDRYANIEIDYLLQRMEQFDGLAILTTNRKSDLDKAFMRRLRFTIEFAPPTAEERARLWRLALEDARDTQGRALTEPLDWEQLGRELDLTGSGVKAAALAAAFLARSDGTRITQRHVLAAARRELEKQGVVVRTGRSPEPAAAEGAAT